MRALITACVLAALVTAATFGVLQSGHAQDVLKPLTDSTAAEVRQAALDGLARFGPVLLDDKRLGFTPAELNKATVGSPIQTAFVPLDGLAQYKAGQPPTSIIRPEGTHIVPVLVDGMVRCAIMVKANGPVFTAAGIGGPNMTRLVTQSAQVVAKAHHVPLLSLVALRIPALWLTFIARFDGTQIWLTPVSDAPTYSLRAGEELPAEVVFARLQPAAQRYRPPTLRTR